ncbi:unnamed protein product [Amoebophrya sp. A120]|nr:unnamed protein product [Amoebophrya sp. A120]|eukprot:GSA120T00006854001.1
MSTSRLFYLLAQSQVYFLAYHLFAVEAAGAASSSSASASTSNRVDTSGAEARKREREAVQALFNRAVEPHFRKAATEAVRSTLLGRSVEAERGRRAPAAVSRKARSVADVVASKKLQGDDLYGLASADNVSDFSLEVLSEATTKTAVDQQFLRKDCLLAAASHSSGEEDVDASAFLESFNANPSDTILRPGKFACSTNQKVENGKSYFYNHEFFQELPLSQNYIKGLLQKLMREFQFFREGRQRLSRGQVEGQEGRQERRQEEHSSTSAPAARPEGKNRAATFAPSFHTSLFVSKLQLSAESEERLRNASSRTTNAPQAYYPRMFKNLADEVDIEEPPRAKPNEDRLCLVYTRSRFPGYGNGSGSRTSRQELYTTDFSVEDGKNFISGLTHEHVGDPESNDMRWESERLLGGAVRYSRRQRFAVLEASTLLTLLLCTVTLTSPAGLAPSPLFPTPTADYERDLSCRAQICQWVSAEEDA